MPMIWLALCCVAGAAIHIAFDLSFWAGFAIGAIALMANGLLAEWEDRRPGGFLDFGKNKMEQKDMVEMSKQEERDQ